MESTLTKSSNLQVVQQAFGDFAKANIPAILNVCMDDVVWASYKVPGADFTITKYGKEGVQEYFKQLDQQLQFHKFEPKEFIVQQDRVVVFGHEEVTVKSTGKRFSNEWCFSFIMKDGMIKNFFAYVDSYDLFRSLQ